MADFETKGSYLGMGNVEHIMRALPKMRPSRRFTMPVETASSPVINARCEQGRWLVDCPLCGSADLADEDDPRYFCFDCRNKDVGGKWLPVQWPNNRHGIETALLARSRTVNRNWFPGESIADLERETAANEGRN